MASILRSGKFVRYFSGIARNIVFNSTGKETETSFVQHSQTLCAGLANGFSSIAVSVPKQPNADQSLERSLKRLDHDVRRTGRISRRDLEEVLEEIRAHRTATSSQSLLVIRCCGNLVPEELPETRTALVQEIWKTLNNLGVPMDVSHYNALLRVYLENEHSFEPTAFLADLEAKGIEPNRVTFQRLISRYCQQGDIEGATRILEFMREKQLPINEHVFNALIMGHSQAEDLESSLGIIAVMRQAGLEPTADTYTTLLCSYAKVGDLASIQSTLDACEQKDMYLLDKDLFDVIYTLATNGHGAHVAALLPRLRKAAGYNQDAVNLILRLVNRGQERIAYDVLKTMPRGSRPDGEPTDTGVFFVRQLVRAGRPHDSVLELCADLERTGLNGKAFLVAIEAAVTSGSVELSVPLLRHLKQSGQPIRQHYFWPLLCAQAKLAGTDAVLDVLRQMSAEFGLTVNGETVREYVIPHLQERNSEKVIALLRTAGVSVSTATTAMAYDLLVRDRLREAAKLATVYSVYYQPGLYRRPLVNALAKTGDVDAFVRFVRQMYDNVSRLELIKQRNAEEKTANGDGAAATEADGDEEDFVQADGDIEIVDPAQVARKSDLLGQIVVDVLGAVRKDRVRIVTEILRGFVEQGLSVSNAHAERIGERLGSELTPEISELLGRLSAGDLEPVPQDRPDGGHKSSGFAQFSVEQLEKLIEQQDARGENSKGLKRFLLSALLKSRDVPRTEATIKRLEAEGFIVTGGIYAQLIDLLASSEQPDRAIEVLRSVREREPDFVLDDYKVVRLVAALVQQDRLADALAFASENRREALNAESHSYNYNAQCWRVLNALAEAGKADDVRQLFDRLDECKLMHVNNQLLGPLVKVHLTNDDVPRAVDEFETLCHKYKSTPWKNELACRLIQTEDATNLQRLTDLSTNIHGEVNSLYDLVFAFVECGRIRQARKILETPGLRSRPQKINVACERYQQEGKVEPLEGLVEATKDLNHIDRGDIYYNLLLSYCKDKQPEKALGLWTKMQEEDIMPGDEFLKTLGAFLSENGLQVPFVLPDAKPVREKRAKAPKTTEQKPKAAVAAKKPAKVVEEPAAPPKSETLLAFKRALRGVAGIIDIDACVQARKQLQAGDELSVTDQSVYIERLVNGDRLSEANKELLAMLQRGQFPIPRIFRYYLNKLATNGDTGMLQQIDGLISADTKKLISFDNRLCHAHVEAGKTEQYLRHLGERLDSAHTDEERQAIGEAFPRGGAVGVLEKHPELSGQFEELAEKYAAHGIVGPMNVLWIHHFIAGNEEEASRLWTKHVSAVPRLMFQRIVQIAREQQNEQLIRRLLATLKTGQVVTDGALGIVHSCLIDVQAARGQFDEGLQSIEAALKEVQIDQINRTALLRIRDGLEQSGKKFPHVIPDKQTSTSGVPGANGASSSSSSSSSSDSSSDDEPRPTKRHDEKK